MLEENTSGDGAAPKGRNEQILQTAGSFSTQDATGTPQTSPLTITAETEIVIPDNAIMFNILSTDQDLKIGTLTGFTEGYGEIGAGDSVPLPCAELSSIFIEPKTAS